MTDLVAEVTLLHFLEPFESNTLICVMSHQFSERLRRHTKMMLKTVENDFPRLFCFDPSMIASFAMKDFSSNLRFPAWTLRKSCLSQALGIGMWIKV